MQRARKSIGRSLQILAEPVQHLKPVFTEKANIEVASLTISTAILFSFGDDIDAIQKSCIDIEGVRFMNAWITDICIIELKDFVGKCKVPVGKSL